MTAPKSLVTGACGFIGTHMVEVLHEAGHTVRATDLASAWEEEDPFKGRFPGVIRSLGVEFVPSDITRPETLKPLFEGVDYVFHIAGVFSYSAPWELLERVNHQGTRSLFQIAREVNPELERIVVWGAGGVYGLPRPEDLPIKEEMAPDPINDYLKSKWYEEHFALDFGRRNGLGVTVIRPTTVYGPRGIYGGGQLIRDLCAMKVVGAPANFRARIPLIHVRDVCGAALHLAGVPEAAGEIYNVNDDSRMSFVEFARCLAHEAGRPFIILPPVPIRALKWVLTRVARVQAVVSRFTRTPPKIEEPSIAYLGVDFVFSNEKLKGTGYEFLYGDGVSGLRETVQWYRENGYL